MEGPLTIRRAVADDVSALAALRWEWRVDEQGESGLVREEFDPAFAEWAAVRSESHIAFVAGAGSEIVGMGWLAIVERIPGPGVWTRLSGYVQSVYVRPSHRNAGAGAALVGAIVDEARARGLDYLAVHPSERSFSLYRRAGFVESEGVLELDLGA